MPWGLIAAGIAGGSSLLGGVLGADASSTAADQISQAYSAASALEQQMFQQSVPYIKPFFSGGTNSLRALQELLGTGAAGRQSGLPPSNPMLNLLTGGQGGAINPGQFKGSPSYQFQLGQGTQAVTNAAAPTGGLSGNTLQALQGYGTGLANQDFYNYLAQLTGAYNNLTGTLGGLTETGAQSGRALATNALQTASQLGSNIVGSGAAQAAGTIGSANALAGGLSGVGNSALLFSLTRGGGGGAGGVDPFANAVNTLA